MSRMVKRIRPIPAADSNVLLTLWNQNGEGPVLLRRVLARCEHGEGLGRCRHGCILPTHFKPRLGGEPILAARADGDHVIYATVLVRDADSANSEEDA